jgi:cytochrome P450
MNPAFQFEAIRQCTDVFKQLTYEVLKFWDNERKEGPVNVANWMTRFTIDSLGNQRGNASNDRYRQVSIQYRLQYDRWWRSTIFRSVSQRYQLYGKSHDANDFIFTFSPFYQKIGTIM